jgi:hypothetical protein
MRPLIQLSTLCLLIAVVALAISHFFLTARHNAQHREMTAVYNAQLESQAA